VLACLREESAGSGVSVVQTATAGNPPDVAGDIEPPVVQFLPKPFTLTALWKNVRRLMGRMGHEEPVNWNRASGSPELFIG
jgi:hypothetical protein